MTVVSRVTVQITRESAPSTNSSVTLSMPPLPARSAFVTYMGEVPMSPYTTPMVTSMAAMLTGMARASGWVAPDMVRGFGDEALRPRASVGAAAWRARVAA